MRLRQVSWLGFRVPKPGNQGRPNRPPPSHGKAQSPPPSAITDQTIQKQLSESGEVATSPPRRWASPCSHRTRKGGSNGCLTLACHIICIIIISAKSAEWQNDIACFLCYN